jgi:hypothetical protein
MSTKPLPQAAPAETKRPIPITALSILYFTGAAAVALFLATDFTHVVPRWLEGMLVLVAPLQCVVGRGLLKLQNWARIATVILSLFFGFPSIIKIFIAFGSLSIVDLLLNLSFVTLQGMIVWYLLHPETRAAFETSLTVLHLK